MVYIQSKSFVAKIETNDNNTLNAWNFLIDLLKKGEVGSMNAFYESINESSLSKCIIILTLHENNTVLIKSFGLLEKELISLSLAKQALESIIWELFQSTWKGWNEEQKLNERSSGYIQRSLGKDVYLEEVN